MIPLLSIILAGLLQVHPQVVQNRQEPLVLPRLEAPVTLTGRVDDPAWETIEPLPLTSYEPTAGLPPSERTEIRVAYDDDFIYASIRAYDSDPSGIRINSLYRDRQASDDLFHILLDTFNDNESALTFAVTPAGVKGDAIISNDGQGGGSVNSDFSTFWDAFTHVDERGWFAEVRIPFSSLGFQDDGGTVNMGMLVQRNIRRKNERVSFPAFPANLSRAFYRPSLAQAVVFHGVHSRRPLHVTPYLVSGLEQSHGLNQSHTGFNRTDDSQIDAGFDIKYGLTNNLTLDLTFNTDFAQVEADDEQINFSRFSLFFPEKRMFFQERASIFDFNTGGSGRLFHSRRIGLTDAGEQVSILAGGRLTGRIGPWDVGLLNMQTARFIDSPSENFAVARLRRRVVNPYSYAGAMVTSRIGEGGTYNVGYGIDGSVRIRNDDYVTYVWAHSIDEVTRDMPALDASRLRIHWERRTREGLAYQTTLSRSGTHYDPGVGFIPRLNYLRLGQIFEWGWMPGEASALLWHGASVDGALWWRTRPQEIESIDFGGRWSSTTKAGDQTTVRFRYFYEDIPTDFTLFDRAVIPANEYTFVRTYLAYEMSSNRQLRTSIEADVGNFYDGWRLTLDFAPTWNVSRHLELEANYFYNLLNLPSVDDWLAVHLVQLRARTALNTHLSLNSLIQLNSAAHIVSANIRLRYHFRDGNDFWIVYNEGMNMDRRRTDPVLPMTDARTVLLKYTHTFHL